MLWYENVCSAVFRCQMLVSRRLHILLGLENIDQAAYTYSSKFWFNHWNTNDHNNKYSLESWKNVFFQIKDFFRINLQN